MTKEQWQIIVDKIKNGKLTPSISDYGAIMVDGMKMPQKMVKKIMTPDLRKLVKAKRQYTIEHLNRANDELDLLSKCICSNPKFEFNWKYYSMKRILG